MKINPPDFIIDFFSEQLENWPMAKKNFASLAEIKRKDFQLGDFLGHIQFNPMRSQSTNADVRKEAIKHRKCFLCKDHRPQEQNSIYLRDNFELLVNPFPIFPYHCTIASIDHKPQEVNHQVGLDLALMLPGMTVFFNDDGAGASAPDHSHYQAVPKEFLPLINYIENCDVPDFLPFYYITGNIQKEISSSPGYPINSFYWIDNNGTLRYLIIPRKAHRPDCYFKSGEERIAVSPGAIDMAGVIITTFAEDFDKISSKDIQKIYSQVSLNPFINN